MGVIELLLWINEWLVNNEVMDSSMYVWIDRMFVIDDGEKNDRWC
ncbi:protein of unknown function [Candidatus Nitrosocaldus cavascurensis]|jgi:hypothetical protein|uniref:Uncharacterized protein n=1 Tax=Candidatus Nitrosocaldus cavascurensis TaxID=2058097 RepID=A0A2K5ANU9_9ARCH|nr:protein of unknown function [Candidatus Nitrosocaldus cavascurensis]